MLIVEIAPNYPTVGAVTNLTINSTTGAGSFDITFSDGPDTSIVSIQVQDSDNDVSNVSSITVAVANVAPTVTLLGSSSADEGQTLVWAKQTILATGGAGQVFRETTNPLEIGRAHV